MELWPRAARAGATAGAAAMLGELLHLDGSLTALLTTAAVRGWCAARSTAGTLLTTTRLEEPAASNQSGWGGASGPWGDAAGNRQ
jgi:hypothetical protein